MYYEYQETIKYIPSHRILAINRGEKEDFLKVKLEKPEEKILNNIEKDIIKGETQFTNMLKETILDSFKRLIEPSIDREIRSDLTEKAEEKAIKVFGQNSKQLLLGAPIKGKTVIGFDPAYRTGCKIAVIDAEPVPLISPVNDAVFRYRNRNPQINFSWQERNHADHYLVKVSSSPDMENPIIEEKVYKTALQSDSLGQGIWWWQVTPYYEINSAGYTGESSVASFSIVKGGSLKAPKLAVPFKDTTISYKDNLNINFIWSSDSTDANYEVILSDPEDFADIYKMIVVFYFGTQAGKKDDTDPNNNT